MTEEYDCRGYCANMHLSPINLNPEPGELRYGNGYYCSITHRRCVGAKAGFFIWSHDKINPNILERCPSKKTLDDLLKPKE